MTEETARPAAEASERLSLEDLVEAVRSGRHRQLARALSLVETGGPEAERLIGALFGATGRARTVGITGPPGAGKSTLVDRLARQLRERDATVAVLAVDPTSPFSGGAILGDRIRMQALYTDPGTYIRSMATRGAMGGLAGATHDAIDVLDAAGFDWILVETVGVGQDEVDVMRSVDSVAVVTVPGLGDDIQAIKAGLLEIADVFVINKSDREGAGRAERDLRMLLGIAEELEWRPPIVHTVASRGEGVEELLRKIESHREWLADEGRLAARRRRRLRQRVEAILQKRVLAEAAAATDVEAVLDEAFEQRRDPYSVAGRLYDEATTGAAAGEPHPEGVRR